MAAAPAPAWTGALGLLERAVGYAQVSLYPVGAADLRRPTPCAAWDLAALLRHLSDSVTALYEAAELGEVSLSPDDGVDRLAAPGEAADYVGRIRDQAGALLGAWARQDGADLVRIDGNPVTAAIVASTGALEIAVHGWDVGQACGRSHRLPPQLAAELLDLVPVLVDGADRPGRFGPPRAVPPSASASIRLLAALGRSPDWAAGAGP
jgi:uncharacterized protein (TIGR03086 family)